MLLLNQSQNKILSKKVQIANTLIDRLLGLLNPDISRFLVFHTRFGIHTVFMKTPIDVILLDQKNHVVKIKSSLHPNRLFLYHPRYSTVIEMPKGTIKKYRIAINDKISIA